jgi:hypothetical protein
MVDVDDDAGERTATDPAADVDRAAGGDDADRVAAERSAGSRTATVRTDHGTATRARRVATAVAPDNTASMTTTVESTAVRTAIDRGTTGGLQATLDDYLVNLDVAAAVLERLEDAAGTTRTADRATDTGSTDERAADSDSAGSADSTDTAGNSRTDTQSSQTDTHHE